LNGCTIHVSSLSIENAGYAMIIETISRFFIAVDKGDWKTVRAIFDDAVLLDYTSMAGGEPATLTADQIIETWKGLLPGFHHTHHQLGNFVVESGDGWAHVFCYGTATHFLENESGSNVWTVVGSYDLDLIRKGSWRISAMKFNLKYMDGNPDLPKLAQARLGKGQARS
jgi:hypothetical protein